MYDEDDTKIMVYNMKGWPTENGGKKLRAKKIKKHIAKRRILESWLNYSGYADDNFYISCS